MRITSRIRDLFLRCLKDVIRRRRIPFNISIVNDAMRKVCPLLECKSRVKPICRESNPASRPLNSKSCIFAIA